MMSGGKIDMKEVKKTMKDKEFYNGKIILMV